MWAVKIQNSSTETLEQISVALPTELQVGRRLEYHWGQNFGPLCTVHTYTNSNTIEYDFVYLENLNNIFINLAVNRTLSN